MDDKITGQTQRAAVIGAGSWGTTLACVLAEKGFDVALWARSAAFAREMESRRENSLYLPGVRLPGNIRVTDSLKDALCGAAIAVCAVPSHGVRAIFAPSRPFIARGAIIISATKGIEEHTGLSATGILEDVLKGAPYSGAVVLSGPSFAKEVSEKLPTAVCAASDSIELARSVQIAFSTGYLRVYTNRDRTGVELGGALKNVIAVASGISDGLCLGNNARAALITRGLAEITRLGVKLGADAPTFSGLSGLGDLVLTCTGALSRNYSVGFSIGKGKTLDELLRSTSTVAEGVRTSRAVVELSDRHGVEMPISRAVCSVLYEGMAPRDAVYELMARDLKGE